MAFSYLAVSLLNKIHSERLEQFFTFIGAYSMNLWFLHGIFFTESKTLQPVLYFPKYSILILLLGLAMLVPTAVIVSKIQNLVIKKGGIDYIFKFRLVKK